MAYQNFIFIIVCAFMQGIQRSLGELYSALKAQTHDQESVKVNDCSK